MPEKTAEKFLKNREKPINTGVLRFLVYGIIAQSPRPVTIAQILQQIEETGNVIARRTVEYAVTEMFRCNPFSPVKIDSIIVRAGDSRSRAFYFLNSPKK